MSHALRLFGGASIEGAEGPLTGPAAQRHRIALLAMLAASIRGGITRDKLIAYLWPERHEARARGSLSDSIYRINRALGENTVLAVGDELRLDPGLLPSDVGAFLEALERERWDRAVDAYSGPFLDGFQLPNAAEFERWVDAERDRLARLYADALEKLAGERAAAADRVGAAAAWRRRAEHDRFDSRVAVRLMEALEAAGNRAGALRHARIHAQLLRTEFGTDPDPDVVALEDRLRARPAPAPAPAPAGRSGAAAGAAQAPGLEAGPGQADPRPARVHAPATPLRASGRQRRGAPGALVLGLVLATAIGAWLAFGSRVERGPATVPAIAVLPFGILGTDEQSLVFADGVTEDVLTRLSRVEGLRVIGQASVMHYRDSQRPEREIADELGVSHLLRGSVRRVGDDVRITARLIDPATGANVWSEAYDRRLEDIFAVQGDIARRVAGALQAELAPDAAADMERRPTDDLTAYNLYLRGRFFWHQRKEDALRQAAQLFEQAVERDPDYARAWAGLADTYAVLAFYDYLPPGEAYPRAKRAALRALELDDKLAEAHASFGYIHLYYDWDAATAEAAFRRAIELNPSYSVAHQWYANLLVATGRFDEAERAMGRAREVNPLSLIASGALAWVYYYAGRYEEALQQCDLALEMDPEWDLAYLWRGLSLDGLGRSTEAIASLRRAVELSSGSGITRAALAHAHAQAGETDRARELLRLLVDATAEGHYQPSFEIARVHAALGDTDEAIRWLEQAFDERSHSMVFLQVDPQLAPIALEPDFRRLVRRVDLTR